jgi:copper chaperone CopZ
MNQTKVKVSGMNCNHCKIIVENGLTRIPGIETAIADIINGEVTVKGSQIDIKTVKSTIEDLGYKYTGEINQ